MKCRYQISSAPHVFGITFTRQAQSQKIGKPNNYDNQILLRSPMPAEGNTLFLNDYKVYGYYHN